MSYDNCLVCERPFDLSNRFSDIHCCNVRYGYLWEELTSYSSIIEYNNAIYKFICRTADDENISEIYYLEDDYMKSHYIITLNYLIHPNDMLDFIKKNENRFKILLVFK